MKPRTAAFLPVLALLLAKGKFLLLPLLKLKIIGVALSMLVSAGAYALLLGWWFAVGLVLLLFVHEMGHVVELKRQGLAASLPMFIPFLGAAIIMKELPRDAWKEARMALAGPVLGSLAAAGVWAWAVAVDSNLLRAIAFVGFLLNLFNLIPILPLDGGRATGAIHPAVWVLGLVGMVALFVVAPNPILLLVFLLGMAETWRRWKERYRPDRLSYYRIGARRRVAVTVAYLGLVAILVTAATYSYVDSEELQ